MERQLRPRHATYLGKQRRHLAWICGLIGLLAMARLRYLLTLVTGASMLPTICPGDLLVVDKWAYSDSDPRRGDLVVVQGRDELLVKRIVGLPGEELEVRAGRLYVNGALVPEAYTSNDGFLHIERGRLLEGRFAALGDNRAAAPELIFVTILPRVRMVGKVVFRLRLVPKRWRLLPSATGEASRTSGQANRMPALRGRNVFPVSVCYLVSPGKAFCGQWLPISITLTIEVARASGVHLSVFAGGRSHH